MERESIVSKSECKTRRADLYKTQLLHKCSDLMAVHKHGFSILGVQIDYFATLESRYHQQTVRFDRTERNAWRESLLKHWHGLFFVGAFLDHVLGYRDNTQLATVHSLYYDSVDLLINNM